MSLSRIALWLVAAVLAAGVALVSQVLASQSRSPATACAMQFLPIQGAACANLAATTFSVRRLKDPKASVTATEAALARRVQAVEPLSAAALSVLAGSTKGASKPALLELSGQVTRRNAYINSELFNLAGQRDDKAMLFLWMSRSIMTNDRARDSYLGVMAEATALDGSVEALTPVIGPGPSWVETYWHGIIRRPKSQPNAAKLRLALAAQPWGQTTATPIDERLALELVNNGEFDTAKQLADALSPQRGQGAGNANRLVNGRFAAQPVFPPFDWHLAATGNLGASIEADKRRLLISAIGGVHGTAARQLFRVGPGNYTLGWSLSHSQEGVPDVLQARIYCAEAGVAAQPPVIVPLRAGKGQAPVALASGACRWHWLMIDVALPDDAAGIDIYLQDLSLVPASGRETRPPS